MARLVFDTKAKYISRYSATFEILEEEEQQQEEEEEEDKGEEDEEED